MPRQPITSTAVWRSPELEESEWVVHLSARQRHAVVDATRRALGRSVTTAAVERSSFDLEPLTDDLARWSSMLESGRGFVLLRGFPVDVLTPEETELAYVGFGSWLGMPVSQNSAGDRLTHIRDERLPETTQKVRLYRTRERQDFHTDGADIIGLLCLHGARRGGESRIVNSGAVYNELLARRADLLDELYQPMCWDRQDDHTPGAKPWFHLAPINDVNDEPRIFYIGWYIRDAQRHPDVPRLTPRQIEAMELLESIANDPAFHLEMDFRPGDIQLLNNGRILHSREAYEDDEDLTRRRHLLRLWLAAHSFASLENELRGGVRSG